MALEPFVPGVTGRLHARPESDIPFSRLAIYHSFMKEFGRNAMCVPVTHGRFF